MSCKLKVSGGARNKCEHYTIIGPIVAYRPTQIKAETLYNLISIYNFIKPVSQFLRLKVTATPYQTPLAFNSGCIIEVYVHRELLYVA
jgi:hypothetical protein